VVTVWPITTKACWRHGEQQPRCYWKPFCKQRLDSSTPRGRSQRGVRAATAAGYTIATYASGLDTPGCNSVAAVVAPLLALRTRMEPARPGTVLGAVSADQ